MNVKKKSTYGAMQATPRKFGHLVVDLAKAFV